MRRPNVEKYEAMAEEATVGPWVAYTFDELDECDRRVIAVQTHRELGLTHRTIAYGVWATGDMPTEERANMHLIAASRTAIPELCAYIRELEDRLRTRAEEA